MLDLKHNLSKSLINRFTKIRRETVNICHPLEIEDYAVQPCAEVSPPKWHLGHTAWFFEEFLLIPLLNNYKVFNPVFSKLFNSYYKSLGNHWLQGDRGQLSRPRVSEIISYREYVDEHMVKLLESGTLSQDDLFTIELGLQHEQQHQELLYMDIKYILGINPERPCYSNENLAFPPVKSLEPKNLGQNLDSNRLWSSINEGLYKIGHEENSFSYDNEGPEHKVYLHDSLVSTQLITNGQYLDFIQDKGYQNPALWLSMGWDWVCKNNIEKPLYWFGEQLEYQEFTLYGDQEIDLNKPVSHISYFEADAYARWAGCRLPTEYEFEVFERSNENGDLANHNQSSTQVHPFNSQASCMQLWSWSSSHYSAYPRFKKFKGAAQEYNGKFMCGQFVLKGGCVVTPRDHYRHTYRNFYQPHQRWMFSGIRLAKD